MVKKRKFLVVAPHIDDEAIGCGGSILKHTNAGWNVSILYVFSGINQERGEREAEAKKACKFIGTNDYHFIRLEDRTDFEGIGEEVVRYLREINPNFIYVPHGDEVDKDHRFVHELIMGVFWKANGNYFPGIPGKSDISGILQYEVHTPIQKPNYYEDISDVVQDKRKLIQIYKSQVGRVNYADGAVALNLYRGIFSEKGGHVEAFKLKAFKNLFG